MTRIFVDYRKAKAGPPPSAKDDNQKAKAREQSSRAKQESKARAKQQSKARANCLAAVQNDGGFRLNGRAG
jgi:hypothetical protein